MDSEHEPREPLQSALPDVRVETRTLESAESHVAGSPGTGCPGDACGAGFKESFEALVVWAEGQGLIRDEQDFSFFRRPPDGFGDEHQAWFDEKLGRWFKATYENRFGLAWGRDDSATAREYLSRLVLQNEYFWDDIQLVALVNCSRKLRVLTSQPHIAGVPSIYPKTEAWFIGLGFCRIECHSRIAWYERTENLLVADAHEGNVIETATGKLVPIDLNILKPVGELRDWAINNCPTSN